MDLTWMAWTLPTLAFVVFILLCLIAMVICEIKYPGGNPRRGPGARSRAFVPIPA